MQDHVRIAFSYGFKYRTLNNILAFGSIARLIYVENGNLLPGWAAPALRRRRLPVLGIVVVHSAVYCVVSLHHRTYSSNHGWMSTAFKPTESRTGFPT